MNLSQKIIFVGAILVLVFILLGVLANADDSTLYLGIGPSGKTVDNPPKGDFETIILTEMDFALYPYLREYFLKHYVEHPNLSSNALITDNPFGLLSFVDIQRISVAEADEIMEKYGYYYGKGTPRYILYDGIYHRISIFDSSLQ